MRWVVAPGECQGGFGAAEGTGMGMTPRIDCRWCPIDGGRRYVVDATYRGQRVSTTVTAASVTDQRIRQGIEQGLATGLAAMLDLPDELGPLR